LDGIKSGGGRDGAYPDDQAAGELNKARSPTNLRLTGRLALLMEEQIGQSSLGDYAVMFVGNRFWSEGWFTRERGMY